MYCKRNWLAEHRTPFIFLQPFHLHRDPNLTTVRSWYSTGILWEPRPKSPWQKITDNAKETAPSCGHISKGHLWGGEFFFPSRAQGSFLHAVKSHWEYSALWNVPVLGKTNERQQRQTLQHKRNMCVFCSWPLTVGDGDIWTAACHGSEEACWAPDTSNDPLCPCSPTSLQHRARSQSMSSFAFHFMNFMSSGNQMYIRLLISHVLYQQLSNLI